MGKENDILFELIDIWAGQRELYSKQGTVTAVDEDNRTCTVSPTDGGADYLNVRLEADFTKNTNTDPKGFFIVPAINSLVIISFTDKTNSFISAWTEIEKTVSKQGQWTFNLGENGGLTITPELKAQLDKTNALLTALINIINGAPVPEPGNGSASALQIALSAAITGQSLGSYENIENEAVKH